LKPASIQELPEEVLVGIFKSLPAGELGRNLPAIQSTCKAFRNAGNSDVHLKRMGRIARLANASAREVAIFDINDLVWRVPLLPFLGPTLRTDLVNDALDPTHYGSGKAGVAQMASAIGHVARGVAHLDKPLQAKLVHQAIQFTDGNHSISALEGFGTELAHLDQALCTQLIDKSIGLEKDEHRASAIKVFSTGLAHLNRHQQQGLLTAAIRISDRASRDIAIAYLCKGLKYLDAGHQKILFEKATLLPLGYEQAAAIRNLGGSLKSLSRDQRDTLVTSARNLGEQGDDDSELIASCGLAEGLVHLEPHQIDKLVTESTTRLCVAFGGEELIAALGTNLHHLTEAQQDKLFDATTRLTSRDRAIAIAGLTAGFASLDTSVRKDRKNHLGDQLVNMALGLPYGNDMANAIAALGPRLGHLEEARREGLVDAAIRLFKDDRSTDPHAIRALGAGLGAGFKSLGPGLRSKLIDSVTRPRSCDDTNPLYAELYHAAEAIAGLGAGFPHLDEAEAEALLAAAAWLPRPRRRPHWDFKRIALQGFAAEAAKAAIKQ
jgi:hypothetical protein